MMSCDDKCVFKIGAHEYLLALFPMNKAGWVAEEVETQESEHDATYKIPLTPVVTFRIDVQITSILIVSTKERHVLELKKAPLFLNHL